MVTIERGLIPLASVDAAYLATPKVGYIHINKFSGTTHREFAEQLEELQKKGLQQLIIDLRDNGGGILQEAVDIADELLDGDKLIVYTQGDKQKRQDYRCKKTGLFEKGKLVVLSNESSASASEILMGALQDWDRATIVGRRSFGKGLVQEQYDLTDGSAMRLTVARYYTPSGRCIQKPYTKGAERYRDDIINRYYNGEMLHADSNHFQKGTAYKTASGKTVYGGGGIMPDVFVPGDTSTTSVTLSRLFVDNSLNDFAYRYYMRHKSEVNAAKNATDFYRSQKENPRLWSEFVAFTATDSIPVNDLTAKEKNFVKKRLIAVMARQQWRSNGSFEVLNVEDASVKKAMEILEGKN
jgi:carboxyl-terminal processing protease